MGIHSQHGNQQERKVKYLEIFQSIDHKPSTRELAQMIGVSHNCVARDLRELGLIEIYNSLKERTILDLREPFYKEWYFDLPLSQRPSTHQLAKKLCTSHNTVARDLRALSKKYNVVIHGAGLLEDLVPSVEIRQSNYLKYFEEIGYICSISETSRKFNYPKSIVQRDYKEMGLKGISHKEVVKIDVVEGVKIREDYYIRHYFFTLKPFSYEKMAKELNISPYVVKKEIMYLTEECGKERLVRKTTYAERKSLYDHYFSKLSNEEKKTVIISKMARKLRIPIQTVLWDFKCKKLYEYYKIK